jgi:hypothetical protein
MTLRRPLSGIRQQMSRTRACTIMEKKWTAVRLNGPARAWGWTERSTLFPQQYLVLCGTLLLWRKGLARKAHGSTPLRPLDVGRGYMNLGSAVPRHRAFFRFLTQKLVSKAPATRGSSPTILRLIISGRRVAT